MSERKGVVLMMFDLPSVTADDRREYALFRKNARKQGFVLLQESCYLKLVRNLSAMEREILDLKTVLPRKGNVSVLPLTLNEFRGIRSILGESFDMSLFADDVCCVGGDENEEA